ncbi:uncharacterized protein SOCE26_009050 [Sorangium cellulosum]|uniref:Secreted protein n=1 Tax=Sorangium cellulosum TaxID=56 RepID=A0A2L0EJN3_SORCE|nr:hypothetical protein [Sorangium cellulosum]AUX39512.1 uncharacterized protein SOCE26_009050 [Sorangium cellulosum]
MKDVMRTAYVSLAAFASPLWRAVTPQAEKEALAHARARYLMARYGIEAPNVERALVEMAAWAEALIWAAQARAQA